MRGGGSRSEFRAGWPAVAAATLGIAFGLPTILFYTLGQIGPELARTFGWSHAAINGGLTVMMTALVLLAPIVGFVANRVGVRTSVAVSQAALGLALMAFGLQHGSLLQYYATWALVAVLGVAATPAVITLPLITRFDRRRGLALGIALLGTGLFATTMKPLVAYSLDAFGWRLTYIGLGCLPILIGIPLTLWGLRERGTAGAAAPHAPLVGLTFVETLREWRFWVLAGAFLPCALTLAGILPHIEGIMRTLNLSRADIVAIGSAVGAALMTGRLVCGLLIDRYWAPGVGAAILLLAAAGAWLLSGNDVTFWKALLGTALIGFAGGAEYDLVGYLAARYFGTRSYAAISGSLFAVFTLGGGVGPLLYARAVDAASNYRGSLVATALILIIAAVPLLCLGRYRTFEPSQPVR
jgi:MFS family permease